MSSRERPAASESGSTVPTTFSVFSPFNVTSAMPLGSVPQGVKGCEECNRSGDEAKPWPIFTVDYNGEEVCAKCLTPMRYPRIKT